MVFGVTLIFARRADDAGGTPTIRLPQRFDDTKVFFEKTKSNRECSCCFESSRAILIAQHCAIAFFFRRNDRSSRGKAACARFTARLAEISVTPKPNQLENFRQEWVISYIKCTQNFSSIGKRIHARKKWQFFWPTLYTVSHREWTVPSLCSHENFEKFKIISTLTGSWWGLRRDRFQLSIREEIILNFSKFSWT